MGNRSSKQAARRARLATEFSTFYPDMPDIDARVKKFLGQISDSDSRFLTKCPTELVGCTFVFDNICSDSDGLKDIKLILQVFKVENWYAYLRIAEVVFPPGTPDDVHGVIPCEVTRVCEDGIHKIVGDYTVRWYRNNSTLYIESKGNQEPVVRYMYRWSGGPGGCQDRGVQDQTDCGSSGQKIQNDINDVVEDRLVFAGVLTPYGVEPFVFNEHTYVRLTGSFGRIWKKVVTKPVTPGEEYELGLKF